MAKIGEVKFTLADNMIGVEYAGRRWQWYCCVSFPYLCRLWEVPLTLAAWDVSLHDCPGDERWEMRIERASTIYTTFPVLQVRRNGEWETYLNRESADHLLRILPKRFYAQLEY